MQRFANYKKALSQLEKFIAQGQLNELEQQGLIQAFEYTHEVTCG
ncbi:MAG: nucleotidyltransferase substrate binding protein, partial [Legionellales bacterium]